MDFPLLQSGQLVQYTTVRSQPIQHWEHHFAGLERQAHRWTNAARTVWRLRYEGLNGAEAMRLRGFFESLAIEEQFSFTDPWTGAVQPHCRVAGSRVVMTCDTQGRYAVEMEIENAD